MIAKVIARQNSGIFSETHSVESPHSRWHEDSLPVEAPVNSVPILVSDFCRGMPDVVPMFV